MSPLAVPLSALGVAVEVRGEDRSLVAQVGESLADLAVGQLTGAPDAVVSLRGHGPWQVVSPAHRATANTRTATVSHLHAAVNLSAVGRTTLLALHAAVLAREDRTIVIVGRSGMGKTTATAALLMQGWDYVSDEALALRWRHAAPVAYPRPLGLSAWACKELGVTGGLAGNEERFVRAEELGACVRRHVAPVTDIFVLAPEIPHFVEASVRKASAPEVLAALLPRSFTFHHDGGRSLQVLGDLVQNADNYLLSPGPPRGTAALLTEVLSR